MSSTTHRPLYHYFYMTQLFTLLSVSSALILEAVFKHPIPKYFRFMFLFRGYILYWALHKWNYKTFNVHCKFLHFYRIFFLCVWKSGRKIILNRKTKNSPRMQHTLNFAVKDANYLFALQWCNIFYVRKLRKKNWTPLP